MLKLDIIAGARPNFMKIGPIIHAITKYNNATGQKIQYRLIHTGQHYDKKMSDDFFEQLNIPQPNVNLGVGSGTQATQAGNIMMKYEASLTDFNPHICLVVGDVTSTMACAIVAKKAGIKVAHVEAGIRSGDMLMPEEINRLVTDSITDYFFTTSEVANRNLKKSGIPKNRIFFVGNTMIDSLLANLERLRKPDFFDAIPLKEKEYLVATLHRPSNVDDAKHLDSLLTIIDNNAEGKKLIFPMHPRTKKVFDSIGKTYPSLFITEPMSYLEFIYLVKNSGGVITDSGGITEETTVLGIPCMTLRTTTERPETVTMGSNELVGIELANIEKYVKKLVSGKWKKGKIPPLWDGHTSFRIIKCISNLPSL